MRFENCIGYQTYPEALKHQQFPCSRWGAQLLLFIAIFACQPLLASILPPPATVTLEWDPSPSEEVVAYKVYYGTTSREYTEVVETGAATSVTISNLVRGTTYYFAATAVSASGLESDFSAEIDYTPPLTLDPTPQRISLSSLADGQMQISGSAAPNSVHVVYASEDINTWVELGVITADAEGHLQFTDPDALNLPQRFYRFQQVFP